MATYRELLEKESPEMQARVAARVEETSLVIALSQLRDELEISQTELARAIGISQPTLAKMENPENDPRLSTLKRYVAALGGELSIDVTLPTGKRVAFHL
ncbi:helix-turn-helix transcriptional regulator (plasmid) [Pectobacterium parvum]|jgi:transcriptional regulator with XRE-family HTH domain|uniref:Transcriptional regulator n=2 Tax=Enterobacterales TaxID=91347 RepID=A0A0M2EWP2_9GAMM|nr:MULTISPECIES: helix-turn-helix transcriptional regulator [Pectobacterium]GKW35958.1 transcriptional regulator [Pectobacterium carotovorum subsp. carotovorum]KGA30338.1 transcriptional regulator [Pectobacterium brasiliense]MCL6375661.1 XRE family transcriptional regulator [Pectobacterium atrosepticum]POE16860.1 transcriptional regulator [Pectobacterium odoriferum]RUR87085.1 transcriptional regulator [Pectobacterium versatile]